MPTGTYLPAPPAPTGSVEAYHLAVKIGAHEAKIESLEASRDKLGERMGALEVGQARIEAGQAHATEMRNAQHAEVLASLGELKDLPRQMALFVQRLDALTTQATDADAREKGRDARSFTVPAVTAKGLLAILAVLAALLGVANPGVIGVLAP